MTSEVPTDIHYDLLSRTRGRLSSPRVFVTPICGYEGRVLEGERDMCSLTADGRLVIYRGFEWDFGSFALDTPVMVRASLVHDAFCVLTNQRLVPWAVRKQADGYFRELLILYGCPEWFAWVRYFAVRAYSNTFAKYRDRERRRGVQK